MTATRRGGVFSGRLGSVWERLNYSFWFIPALLVLGCVILYSVAQYLDQVMQVDLASLPIVFSGGPTAARSVLSTIAGSLITVLATMFSLTIVALQLASSYYSPRVLRNFTKDRGVQLVLGTYVATFLYSLLVLRVIRTAEGEGTQFNPVISMTVAVVLALACVVLLLYFIAHIVSMIQSSTIVRSAHHDAVETIAELKDLDDESSAEPKAPEDRLELVSLLADNPLVLRAKESGYVQYLNVEAVVNAVSSQTGGEETVVVEVPFGPGRFVTAGLPIVQIWPAHKPVSEGEVHEAFYFGQERSFRQDFAFGLRQLSDIALKALSPAFNDPTTAMQAMDRMEAIFITLGAKALPPRVQEEQVSGTKVLVKVGRYGFDDVVGLAFDQLRRTAFAGGGYVAVLERLLEILEYAILANLLPERRRSLWARAFTIARLVPEQIPDPEDAVNLVRRAVDVGVCLLETELGTEVAADLEELASLSENLRGGARIREAVSAAQEKRSDRRADPR